MAESTPATHPAAPTHDAPAAFRRATAADALDVARRMFDGGERLDMRVLAERLGIGRTTLYRWVGDREELIGSVLAAMSDRTFRHTLAHARGAGVPRALGTIRAFMQLTSDYRPLCDFAVREPGTALRVLMAQDGAVARSLHQGFKAALDDAGIQLPEESGTETLDILVQLATALEWTPVVVGQPAAIDRAVRLMHTLLTSVGHHHSSEPD
ncbi:QsdR family transcriptional regulator [Streptomyces sp. NPDC050400]|uniref:QsdR family transcriptional regulator n=1 Tax=Streptomyces sp. NPDC050400 TaxID=3365610 RepID=UPI0037979345